MILKLGAGALIVGTAITAGGCANSDTSSHAAGAATASAASVSSATSVPSSIQNPEEKMPRISVEDSKKLVAEGKAILIDVRPAESYKMSHIKGAPNVPLSKLEAGDFKDLPKDKLIIAYCG